MSDQPLLGGFGRSDDEERRPFGWLLLSLTVFLVLVPIVDETGTGRIIISLGFTGILIAGLVVALQSRRLLLIMAVLFVANLVAQWLATFILGNEVDQETLKGALGAMYFVVLCVVLLRALARQSRASIDAIYGGINVYLLMAIAFALIHRTVEAVEPGSYLRGGVPLSEPEAHPHGAESATFLYFSFVTLTTLGYGDISPARPIAQFLCSAEALIGQLYVAILIGGLVALWISARESQPGRPAD